MERLTHEKSEKTDAATWSVEKSIDRLLERFKQQSGAISLLMMDQRLQQNNTVARIIHVDIITSCSIKPSGSTFISTAF